MGGSAKWVVKSGVKPSRCDWDSSSMLDYVGVSQGNL